MILVTGATGSTGRELVRQLADSGVRFRAMVRDEEKGHTLGCPFVVADFDHPESLGRAFAGVDRVLLNSGGAVPVASGPQPMVRQQRAAIDAARAAGVAWVVKVSAWRPRPDSRLSVLGHWEIEQYLKASGMSWSMLRPTGYTQNFFTGDGGVATDGDLVGPYGTGRVAYLDAYDVARCAAALLTGERGRGESFPLTGPEALNHEEIAGKLTTALGRPVRFRDISPREAAEGMRQQGLPDSFVTDLLFLWSELAAGDLAEVTSTVSDLTGRPPRTFDAFLASRAAR